MDHLDTEGRFSVLPQEVAKMEDEGVEVEVKVE
jgi:hypothetical protein